MPFFSFFFHAGKTYRLRISNVGLQSTLNLLIQEHCMTLVEVEGTHTVQNSYTSVDVHAGQSLSVLFTADRPARDYRVVVSTRFTGTTLRSTAVIRYAGSSGPAFEPLLPCPPGPATTTLISPSTRLAPSGTNTSSSGRRAKLDHGSGRRSEHPGRPIRPCVNLNCSLSPFQAGRT